MRAHLHRVVAVAVVLVAATLPALSQGVGVVSGRVTDEQGVPMEGVTLTLTSPGIIGALTATTDERGQYWFPGIPGNHPLTVSASAECCVPMKYVGHTARRNGTIAIDFRLRRPGQHEVLVLIEEGVPYHHVALEGALSTLPGHVTTFPVADLRPATARDLRERLASRPSAVLAIGERAARLARRHIRDVPIVYAMVPAPLDSDLSTANMCGVPLNGGFEAQMEHLRHVLPEARRIGTIIDPRRMGLSVRKLREAAALNGFELVSAHVYDDDDAALDTALDGLRGTDLDAFLVLLDPRLMSAGRFEQIARFAEAERLVLAVPDASLAVDENSFSFVPGFFDLGQYAGTLVRRILDGQAQPSQIGLSYPGLGEPELDLIGTRRLTPRDVLPTDTAEAVAIARDE